MFSVIIPEEPTLGKAQEISPNNYILPVLTVVFLCLVVVCFVVVMIIWKRKTISFFEELCENSLHHFLKW
jgi:succinate dehydrogenase hydrophobic anchor subunit